MHWICGLVTVAALVVIVVIVMRMMTSCSTSGYTAQLTERDKNLIHALATQVAPRLGRRDFTRADLAAMAGVASIHPEIYYRFKAMYARTGSIDEKALIRQLEGGGKAGYTRGLGISSPPSIEARLW